MWRLSPSPTLTVQQARDALDAINDELKGGPGERIASALMRIMNTTQRPPWMTDVGAAAYADTIPQALWEYPIDVVEEACAEWRKTPDHGRWWPMEQDLRAIASRLMQSRIALRAQVEALLREKEREERAENVSYFPGERQRRFKDDLAKRLPRQSMRTAFLSPWQMKFDGEDRILVHSRAMLYVLEDYARDLIEAYRLKVYLAPTMFVDERAPEEPTTEEERQIIAEGLRAIMNGAQPPRELP